MKNLLVTSILCSWACLIAQTQVNKIVFEFHHSLRIPNHELLIHLTKDSSKAALHLVSNPMMTDKKWEHTRIDTNFTIEPKKFDEIVTAIKKISEKDIKHAEVMGFDGTDCKIQFGNSRDSTSFSAWLPDYETNKRRLSDFLTACRLILAAAGLKPKEIL